MAFHTVPVDGHFAALLFLTVLYVRNRHGMGGRTSPIRGSNKDGKGLEPLCKVKAQAKAGY